MRRFTLVFVVAVLLGVAWPAGAGEFRGRLLIGERPAVGVTVSAVPYEAPFEQARREARRLPGPLPMASATTGKDGSFVLAVASEPGAEKPITLRVEGGGAAAAAVAGYWDAAETADIGEHLLLPGVKLTGRVSDTSDKPVADAEVTLVSPVVRGEESELESAPCSARTAADGTFQLDGASATGNTLTVEKAGLVTAQLRAVKGGALAGGIVLAAGASVSGTVHRPDGRSPAAGALVRLEGRAATRWAETGANGSFAIPDAPKGIVTVVADAGDAGYTEKAGVSLPLVQGTTLAVVLRPPSVLTGRAVDAKTLRPVPRARIELSATTRHRATRSAPDGTYALRPVPPGSWQLRADEPQYVPWTHARVPLRSGETKRLDIPLVLGASISGKVTDENGQPVADAKGSLSRMGPVNVQRIARRMRGEELPVFRTRPDGTFKAARLAPGESQLLAVAHADFERGTVGGLTLVGGATRAGLAIVLKRGGVVSGVVKGADGQPIQGANVALSRSLPFGGGGPGGGGGPARALGVLAAGGGAAETKGGSTGDDGKFAVRGVAPGEYVLTVKRSGYATERVEPVKVPKSGSPVPLEVTLTPGAVISGLVVRKSGAGAEGVVVRATSPGRPRFDAGAAMVAQPTGLDGAFSIDGLKVGQSYDLQLGGAGEGKRGVMAPATGVVLTAAGAGRITGTAVDAGDSSALTEFQVSYQADRGGGAGGPGRGGARGAGGGAGGGDGQPVDVQTADGSFTLEDVPAGTWSVVVTAKGYQSARTSGVTVEEGGTHDGVEVRVSRGSALKGRVSDAVTGVAVPNATVSIASAGSGAGRGPAPAATTDGDVTTDADGNFELDGVATGKQMLHVSQPDYTDATQAVQVGDDGATVEVKMTAGGVLLGSVASQTGQPVASANVTLSQAGAGGFGFGGGAGGQTNVTDPTGQFRFDHLASGRYTVEAALGSNTSAPSQVVLQAGQPPQTVALQLQIGITVQGTVSGLPDTEISGTTVTAAGADSYFQSTRVGADGHFEFDNVPAGGTMLRGTATDPSGSTRSATNQVTLTADQTVVTADLVFDQGYTLSGGVTQSGQPVSGAMVVANLQGGGGRQASATTDAGGSYQLNGLQAGTYTVSAMSAQAGASQRQTVDVSSDQTLDITFPNATIAGKVVDADSNMPLAGATVTVRSQDPTATSGPGQRPVTTDSTGQFSFTGLDDATYTLSTSKSDYQLDTRDAVASDQSSDPVVVTLKRSAGIAIAVMDGLAGVPLSSVMVRVFDPQGNPVFGPSSIALDGNGQGEIPSLPPGTYTIVAAGSGYAPARLDGVAVPSAMVTIALTPGGTVLIQSGPKTLAPGTATGTIATAGGQPALLSLFNMTGNIALSEPSFQLHSVPPGSYVLSLPAVNVSQSFVVGEGASAVVQLP